MLAEVALALARNTEAPGPLKVEFLETFNVIPYHYTMLYLPSPRQSQFNPPWAVDWRLWYSISPVLLAFGPPPWPQVFIAGLCLLRDWILRQFNVGI